MPTIPRSLILREQSIRCYEILKYQEKKRYKEMNQL
jgi:hypothetical protein